MSVSELSAMREQLYSLRKLYTTQAEYVSRLFDDSDTHQSPMHRNIFPGVIEQLLKDVAVAFWGQWVDRPPYPGFKERPDNWQRTWLTDFESTNPYDVPDCAFTIPDQATIHTFMERIHKLAVECMDNYSEKPEDYFDFFPDSYENMRLEVMNSLETLHGMLNNIFYAQMKVEEFSHTTNIVTFSKRSKEIHTFLVFLYDVQQRTKYHWNKQFDQREWDERIETCASSIGSACRSYRRRMGHEENLAVDSWFIQMKNKIHILAHADTRDQPVKFVDVLMYTFDIPIEQDAKMIYYRVKDPGDMRHIFQENEEWMKILHECAYGILHRGNELDVTVVIKRYEGLQKKLAEGTSHWLPEKLKQSEHPLKSEPLESRSLLQMLAHLRTV